MQPERIDIIVPDAIIAQNDQKRRRLDDAYCLRKPDRVPVVANENQWTLLAGRGQTFANYIRSPEDNLREQILNRKWRLENIRDDQPVETKCLVFQPDFGTLRGTEFPMEVTWLDDGPPKCVHPLRELEDIDRLSVPPPDGGLNARYIQWYHRMSEAAQHFDVRLNGQPLQIKVTHGHGGGPIPAAFALAGSNLFLWAAEDPQRTARLMEIVTASHINCTRFFDQLCGRTGNKSVWLGCDTAEMFGPDMFRRFVAPYYLQVWKQFPEGRSFHMCGRIDHLLDILRDELRIEHLAGFGSITDRHKLADCMAGRVILQGGPEPMLIKTGPADEIARECLSYIRTVGRSGGFIIEPGGGMPPGTPLEHLDAMIQASIRAAE